MSEASIPISTIIVYVTGKVFKVPGKIDKFSVSIVPGGRLFVHVSRKDIHSTALIDLSDFYKCGFNFIDYTIEELIDQVDWLDKQEV